MNVHAIDTVEVFAKKLEVYGLYGGDDAITPSDIARLKKENEEYRRLLPILEDCVNEVGKDEYFKRTKLWVTMRHASTQYQGPWGVTLSKGGSFAVQELDEMGVRILSVEDARIINNHHYYFLRFVIEGLSSGSVPSTVLDGEGLSVVAGVVRILLYRVNPTDGVLLVDYYRIVEEIRKMSPYSMGIITSFDN